MGVFKQKINLTHSWRSTINRQKIRVVNNQTTESRGKEMKANNINKVVANKLVETLKQNGNFLKTEIHGKVKTNIYFFDGSRFEFHFID